MDNRSDYVKRTTYFETAATLTAGALHLFAIITGIIAIWFRTPGFGVATALLSSTGNLVLAVRFAMSITRYRAALGDRVVN